MDSGNKQYFSEATADSSAAEETNTETFISRSKSPLFLSRVTLFDRWLVRTMMDVVGNPEGTLRLWDGVDVTPPVDDPVAIRH